MGEVKETIVFPKRNNDVRVIGASSMEILHTWIDASFAVHNDMKGHTGGTMSFGKGVLHAKSSKQKLNTKSSTETELVGVSEYIPYTIWMKTFLHEQGYKVTGNVYQDNQSSIKMEKMEKIGEIPVPRIHVMSIFVSFS